MNNSTIKSQATNIGNALHTALPYTASMRRNELELVFKELKKDNIKLSDVVMSGNVRIEVE